MVPIARLRPPEGAYQTIKGKLQLDASWLVAAGGGNIYRKDGVPLVAAGALSLIGNDGSTLIGNDGSTLIGNDGSTLIGNDGSTLIGNDGSTLIGNDGSTLIGNDGSTLVAAGGGNAVAVDGMEAPRGLRLFPAFNLFQAPAAPASAPTDPPPSPLAACAAPGGLAYGAQLPAAVMRLGLAGLADGQPIPLGRTDGDRPVTAVYSGLDGGFELFVPPGVTDYVRLVARPPGNASAGLGYEFLVDPVTGQVVADEDRAVLTGYIRAVGRARMEAFMTREPEELVKLLEPPGSTPLSTTDGRYKLIFAEIQRFAEVSKRRRLRNLPLAARRALAQRAADTLLAACTFDTLQCNAEADLWPYRSADTPFNELVAVFRDLRCRAAARMASAVAAGKAPETAFADVPAIRAARHDDGRPWAIKRPSDFCNFLVARYLAPDVAPGASIGPTDEFQRVLDLHRFLRSLDMLTPEDHKGRLLAAGYAIVTHIFAVFFIGGDRPVATIGEIPDGRSPIGEAAFQVFETAPLGPEVPAP